MNLNLQEGNPFLGGPTEFPKLTFELVSSSAGAVSAIGTTVPIGSRRLIIAASIQHDDAVSRFPFFYIQDSRTGAPFVVIADQRVGGGAALPLGAAAAFPLPRKLIIPENWRLIGETDAIGAGNIVSMRVGFYEIRREDRFPLELLTE
jgi:hypothetical protein